LTPLTIALDFEDGHMLYESQSGLHPQNSEVTQMCRRKVSVSGPFFLAMLGISFLLFGGQGSLLAQLTTGTVSGTVKDQTEAVLPGAAVTATHVETGTVRTVVTGSGGEYQILALPEIF